MIQVNPGTNHFRGSRSVLRIFLLLSTCCLLISCSATPYKPMPFDPATIDLQSQTKQEENLRVTAAVPGREQAKKIFGFDLYERGIQPVWLSIENLRGNRVRYVPISTDPTYFSPLEVAYMFHKGFTKQSRDALDRHLYQLSIKRQIQAGSTGSGFVFTHVAKGRKNLVVDVIDPIGDSHSFPFFLEVPGFTPDHAAVNWSSLYQPADFRDFGSEEFRTMLTNWQCCTEDYLGNPDGLPISVVIVGDGQSAMKALMRAEWYETQWEDARDDLKPENLHYLFGRQADAVVRIKRGKKSERNELKVWATPWTLEGKTVWVALISHFIGQKTRLEEALMGARFDPNVDDGRNFLFQNLWYSQSLGEFAWVKGNGTVKNSDSQQDFNGAHYFTDGYRLVLWLSEDKIGMDEVNLIEWDAPPLGANKK